jgi:hypothetical protein
LLVNGFVETFQRQTNTRAEIEKLLDVVFSMLFMSHQLINKYIVIIYSQNFFFVHDLFVDAVSTLEYIYSGDRDNI